VAIPEAANYCLPKVGKPKERHDGEYTCLPYNVNDASGRQKLGLEGVPGKIGEVAESGHPAKGLLTQGDDQTHKEANAT
jgi:hypothetical protein